MTDPATTIREALARLHLGHQNERLPEEPPCPYCELRAAALAALTELEHDRDRLREENDEMERLGNELMQERDRYRHALEQIADHGENPYDLIAPLRNARRAARAALADHRTRHTAGSMRDGPLELIRRLICWLSGHSPIGPPYYSPMCARCGLPLDEDGTPFAPDTPPDA